jgi:hypothetical protein
MEASVDLQCQGPDWMPITPKTGFLFHAETQFDQVTGDRGHVRRNFEIKADVFDYIERFQVPKRRH